MALQQTDGSSRDQLVLPGTGGPKPDGARGFGTAGEGEWAQAPLAGVWPFGHTGLY